MANIERYIPFLRKWEGGFVNDKDDKGGSTMTGITLATYRQFYGKDKTADDLKFIPYDEWKSILKRGYWDKMKADNIHSQAVAELCVDMAFMSGSTTAIKKVQRALKLKDDGIIGPLTLKALNGPENEVFETLFNMRKDWLTQIAKKGNNIKFLKGWMNRLNDLKRRHYA